MSRISQDIKGLTPSSIAKLKYGKGNVYLETNGEVAGIEISYRGAFKGVNTLGDGWTIKAGRNKIIIYSLAKTQIKELLFRYIGELKIVRAKYATWNNESYNAKIVNLNRNDWNISNGNWGADGRKYEEIETQKIIYRKV